MKNHSYKINGAVPLPFKVHMKLKSESETLPNILLLSHITNSIGMYKGII